jgi:hypothetical protein
VNSHLVRRIITAALDALTFFFIVTGALSLLWLLSVALFG